MFSGFDFKRFSLDALQDEENEEARTPPPLAVVPEHVGRSERIEIPPPQNKKLPAPDEDSSEWDWNQDNTAVEVETTSEAKDEGASEQRRQDTEWQRTNNVKGDSTSEAIPTEDTSAVSASPAKSQQIGGEGSPDAGETGDVGREGEAAQERRDQLVFPEANAGLNVKEAVFPNEMVRAARQS